MRGIHRSPVNSPHKGPVTRKMFPFDDVIMRSDLGIVKDISGGRDYVDVVRTLDNLAMLQHSSTTSLCWRRWYYHVKADLILYPGINFALTKHHTLIIWYMIFFRKYSTWVVHSSLPILLIGYRLPPKVWPGSVFFVWLYSLSRHRHGI